MRTLRLFLITAALVAPIAVFAEPVPDHPHVEKIRCTGDTVLKGDAVEGFRSITNICINDVVSVFSGGTAGDKQTCICKTDAEWNKVGCKGSKPNTVAGTISIQCSPTSKPIPLSKCDENAMSTVQKICGGVPSSSDKVPCKAVGDSNSANLTNATKFQNACTDGGSKDYLCDKNKGTDNGTTLSCLGRTADDTLKVLNSLEKGTLEGIVPVSEGTNDTQTLEQCKNDQSKCKLDEIYKAVKENANDPNDVQLKCLGILYKPEYNSTIEAACKRNGGEFIDLPGKAGNYHPTDDVYRDVLKEIGQIENPGSAPTASDDLPSNNLVSAASIAQQGSNDQVRTLACALPGVENCEQYGKSMTAVAGAEGAPDGGCSSPTVCGSFQQKADNYELGIKAFNDACGSSPNDVCQTVQQTCINGPSDRINNNLCSAAAAVGLHAKVDAQIQSQISDPARQAAAHMLYQLAPGQFMGGQVSDINTYQLNSAAISAVQNQGISLPANPTGSDAIDGILRKPNMQSGIALAGTGSPGSLGNTVPAPSIGNISRLVTGEYFVVASDGTLTKVSAPSISSGSQSPFSSFGSLGLGTSLGSSMMSPFQSLFSSANASPYKAPPPVPPPPTPTLALTVQPLTVVRGDQITVSWTSSGMSSSAPCTVTQNGASLGSGIAGAKIVTTSATSTLTSVVFRLVCQAATNGQVFQQSSTVTLQ